MRSPPLSASSSPDGYYGDLQGDGAEDLYDHAPCGYLSTAPDGLIVKANQTLLALTGYQASELVGRRRFIDLLTVGGRIYHETHYAPMLQMQGTAREIALDVVCADGRRLPVLVNSVLERDASGAPVVVRTAVFDATHRRAYERELLEAKRRAEDSEARATALARTLQQCLIPPAAPRVDGLDVAGAYRPAGDGGEIGGDFYDVFQIAADEWFATIGDVCGKGVDAAVVTTLARHTIRAAAVRESRPSAVLHALNDVLLGGEVDRFCTAVVLRLRREGDGGWSATLSCGGHPLPLLVRRPDGPVAIGCPGSLVGVLEAPTYIDVTVGLKPGDVMLLYTDGVTEGRNHGEFFGEERLSAAVAAGSSSPSRLVEKLLDEVVQFQQDSPSDDIALVAISVPAQSDEGVGGHQ
jgi:sigma-B regulation protein RsbU (phosphoserine phosphatase)